jgi:hypothetical protein
VRIESQGDASVARSARLVDEADIDRVQPRLVAVDQAARAQR